MIGDARTRSQGLAKLATAGLVDAALASWGLRQVSLECLSSNGPALAVYRACGFTEAAGSGDIVRMTRTGNIDVP